jgi:hypothetical protein
MSSELKLTTLDVAAERRDLAADHVHPLLDREHRRFGRIGGDPDHQPVDQLRAAADDVHVPEGDRIEGAGIDACAVMWHP